MTGVLELTVLRSGPAAVTDLGRARMARHGISAGGAADQYAAMLASTLAGNPTAGALIEITAGDFVCAASRALLFAVTGATATVTVDGALCPQWEPICADAGQTIAITGIRDGLRVYLAVNGAMHGTEVLGSIAPDRLLGIGGGLGRGDVIRVTSAYTPVGGHPYGQPLFRLTARPPCTEPPRPSEPWTLDIVDGPDLAEFPDAAEVFATAVYTLSPRSDQVGLRLDGPAPARTGSAEILSRGVPLGAVEVPPAGELLVLHRARSVTAGYPVVAVLSRASCSRIAQVPPGRSVRLRRQSVDAALAAHRRQTDHLRTVRHRVATSFAQLAIPMTDPPTEGRTPDDTHR